MSRNGSGGYTPPSNSWFPAVNGVSAATADWNATLTDIAAAIQQSISADGQTPITGNLQMGGNKLTGLAAGSGTGQSLRYEQLFSQGTLTDIASAATVDIGAQLTNFLRVTGTTGVTSFGTNYNGPRFLIFAGAVLLTHSATLVLPSAANITTAANDSLIAIPISGGWQVVAYQRADGTPLIPPNISQIRSIGASVSSNALTISASALSLDFRSATLGSGIITTITGTPSNLVVPSSATLGTLSGVSSDLIVLAINNAGSIELAVINISGGVDLSEMGIISTTAISAVSNSASIAYSTTARTNVAYRVIGLVRSNQAVAGTWATSPSLIQGMGGNALDSMQSLGYGQTWQNVTGSRALATNYYNTTGKPITVSMRTTATTVATAATLIIGGVNVVEDIYAGGSNGYAKVFGIIPSGSSYSITSAQPIGSWVELR